MGRHTQYIISLEKSVIKGRCHLSSASLFPKIEMCGQPRHFRDRPHVFYIYKPVSKFCDCIKIKYILKFLYFML